MNPAFRALLVLIAVVMTAQYAAAEEWHGLKPLSSTRADVVRVFGECSEKEKPCEFTFENEDISIDFSHTGNCHSAPADTVLLIKRVLRNATTMKALGFNKRRFKSFDPSYPRNRGYRALVDEKSGLLFKTLRGDVSRSITSRRRLNGRFVLIITPITASYCEWIGHISLWSEM